MTDTIRRVIISQNKEGKSAIVSDAVANDISPYIVGIEDAVSINLWAANKAPAPLTSEDPTKEGLEFLPKPMGNIFRICDIPPDSRYINRLNEVTLNGEPLSEEQKSAAHPMMHQINCLVYGLVLKGEVILVSETEEVSLKTGDVVIDIGSYHAWSNRTQNVARMAFILMDAVRIDCD